MHLSDIQLLDLDDEGKSHLDQCEECARRFQMRLALQDTLKSLPELSMDNNDWQSIGQQFSTQHLRSRSSVFMRKYIAIAASISLVLISIFFYLPSDQQRLNALVEENQQLNLLIEQKFSNNNVTRSASAQLIELELSDIEYDLQQAYVQQTSVEEKIMLWESRRSLLLELLNNNFKHSEFFI